MSKIIIEINTDNASFDIESDPSADWHGELKHCLDFVMNNIEPIYPDEFAIRDSNGNTIGSCKKVK